MLTRRRNICEQETANRKGKDCRKLTDNNYTILLVLYTLLWHYVRKRQMCDAGKKAEQNEKTDKIGFIFCHDLNRAQRTKEKIRSGVVS